MPCSWTPPDRIGWILSAQAVVEDFTLFTMDRTLVSHPALVRLI